MGIDSWSGVRLNSGVCGIIPLSILNLVLSRHLPGLIPVTQRRLYRLVGHQRAPPRSPLRVGDQPTAACSVIEVETLALKGSLGMGYRWVPISVRTPHRRQREALQGLVTTGGTPGDVDAGPSLHPLRHALRLRRWRWLPLS